MFLSRISWRSAQIELWYATGIRNLRLNVNLSKEGFYLVWMLRGTELVREPSILDNLTRQLHPLLTITMWFLPSWWITFESWSWILHDHIIIYLTIVDPSLILKYSLATHCVVQRLVFLLFRAKWVGEWGWERSCTAVMNIPGIACVGLGTHAKPLAGFLPGATLTVDTESGSKDCPKCTLWTSPRRLY